MVTPESRVVETRRFLVYPTQWFEIARKCIAEKKFLIVTVCVGRDKGIEYYPTDIQWQNVIEDTIIKVMSVGGNINNWRLDIINEPMKFVSVIQYTNLINIAYQQAKGRVLIGAGCEEFVTAQARGNMYDYICRYASFNVLVIHMQGSCSNEAETIRWTNYALDLATRYRLKLDCNEANLSDIGTSSGYSKLQMLLKHAERIGCENFAIVFNNLDQSAFAQNTDKWKPYSFKVNGIVRSKYWNNWLGIINSKAPIPNIIEVEDDMKLDKLYRMGSRGIGVKFIQKILNADIKPEPLLVEDGIWGLNTANVVKQYQTFYGLLVDGIVGPQTMKSMILEYPEIWNEICYEYAIGVR